jgi:hypothetical protein
VKLCFTDLAGELCFAGLVGGLLGVIAVEAGFVFGRRVVVRMRSWLFHAAMRSAMSVALAKTGRGILLGVAVGRRVEGRGFGVDVDFWGVGASKTDFRGPCGMLPPVGLSFAAVAEGLDSDGVGLGVGLGREGVFVMFVVTLLL